MATWQIDGSHTSVTFSVRHLMITNVRGEFKAVRGSATYAAEAPEQTKLEVEIDVASIHTREEKRDAHLRSPDFFDADKFPKMTFRSTDVKRTDDGLAVLGELTIRDVTRPVTLAVEGPTEPQTDPWGNQRIGASATTKIKRSDFGMKWNAALEAGGVLVGDDVKIQLDVSLVKAA